jgi:hypothetical protein
MRCTAVVGHTHLYSCMEYMTLVQPWELGSAETDSIWVRQRESRPGGREDGAEVVAVPHPTTIDPGCGTRLFPPLHRRSRDRLTMSSLLGSLARMALYMAIWRMSPGLPVTSFMTSYPAMVVSPTKCSAIMPQSSAASARSASPADPVSLGWVSNDAMLIGRAPVAVTHEMVE